jgi:hypothetical protein
MIENDPFVQREANRAAWDNGGMESVLAGGGIIMTHDDLVTALGPEASKKIADAGFVLVPREWRERVFRASRDRAAVDGEVDVQKT